MHKTTAKGLRFGCGASLQSAFAHGHAHGTRNPVLLMEKDSVVKVVSKTAKASGRRKE